MTRPLRLGVLGISGRMGQAVRSLLEKDKRFALQVNDPKNLHFSNCDVVVDFSKPAAVLQSMTLSPGPAWVVGSTGWTPSELQALEDLADSHLILRSANFSLGIALLKRALSQISPALIRAGYQASIIDTHHHHKKDAPSGTALALAQSVTVDEIEPEIVSFRVGEVIGDHEIRLIGPSDELRFEHRAHSRALFAHGALEVASWVGRLRASEPTRVGLLSMDDFISAKA